MRLYGAGYFSQEHTLATITKCQLKTLGVVEAALDYMPAEPWA
jgi:hypothetical protein